MFRLPTKDSATASAARVFLYVVVPQIILFVQNPENIEFINRYFPNILPAITAGTPILCFVYNLYRKDVKNY